MASMPKVDVTLKIDGHVSEREAVLRERRAAMKVLNWLGFDARPQLNHTVWTAAEVVDNLFPLPKTPQPRVVEDTHEPGHLRWRVGKDSGGKPMLEYSLSWVADGEWMSYPDDRGRAPRYYVTPSRAALWADLFANPTELVDDDGSAGGSL